MARLTNSSAITTSMPAISPTRPTRSARAAWFPIRSLSSSATSSAAMAAARSRKTKRFVYLSYEALRQRQSVPLSATTLSAAQVAQAQASSDPIIKSLLPLIPAANEGTNGYAFSMSAPVNIHQGTVNFSQIFSETQPAQRLLRDPAGPAERAVHHRRQQFCRHGRSAQRPPSVDQPQ